MRGLATVVTLFSLVITGSASASTSDSANQARLDRTVRYLQEAQQSNGGFGTAGEPSQISSAWTALALAAAGINPRDQARPGGEDAYDYLVAHFEQGVAEAECAPVVCTTTYERELMMANAAGASPHDFGGVDLVAGLLDRARPDGSFAHVPGGGAGVNDTIFAIFALDPVAEAAAQAPVQRAADWVESAQLDDGGWAWGAASPLDEVDMTGAAVQALVAAGRGASDAVRDGIAYLRAAQNADGGFPVFPGGLESNAASTAWATQAIWSVGEDPEAWLSGAGGESEEPLGYMESLQQPDGHIRWKRSVDLNGVWMTAYVAPAFAGQAWPIPAAPRAAEQPVPARPGEGEGSQSGAGVIAGGGGAGAPLFSRPRPQSRGRTPGGARLLDEQPGRARDHSETRRGERVRQSDAAVNAEPSSWGEATTGGSGDRPQAAPSGSPSERSAVPAGGAPREVTGTVVGEGGVRRKALAFGAPGLHSAGTEASGASWPAIAIAAAALLCVLAGSRIDHRRAGAYA
jgi:hypothetical protein